MVQATKFAVDPAWRIILKDLGISEDEVLRAGLSGLDGPDPRKCAPDRAAADNALTA